MRTEATRPLFVERSNRCRTRWNRHRGCAARSSSGRAAPAIPRAYAARSAPGVKPSGSSAQTARNSGCGRCRADRAVANAVVFGFPGLALSKTRVANHLAVPDEPVRHLIGPESNRVGASHFHSQSALPDDGVTRRGAGRRRFGTVPFPSSNKTTAPARSINISIPPRALDLTAPKGRAMAGLLTGALQTWRRSRTMS
jgi:hypothetical protein